MTRHVCTSPLKLLISATLALALSVTPVAADSHRSRSDTSDATTVIGILLGLATIGALLSRQDEWKERYGEAYRPHKETYRPYKQVRPVPKRLQLPAHCLRTYRTQQGKQKYFSRRCLKRNFAHAAELPRSCRDTIVARDKTGTYVARKVYRSGCLSNRGYRTKTTY